MTSESSLPDAAPPESRREDGAQGATMEKETALPSACAETEPSATHRNDTETASPGQAQLSEADETTNHRDGSTPELESGAGTAADSAGHLPNAASEPQSTDASPREVEVSSAIEMPGGALDNAEHAPAASPDTVTIELDPELPQPPPPPSQRPKTARKSTAEPLGITASLPPPVWPPRVVADLMTRKLITMRENEPLGDLEVAMQRFRFHHVPVVTAEMKLVGLITRTDLLHARLGMTPDGGPAAPIDANTRADAIMRRNVVVGRLDYSLATACRVMLDNALPCLPVVRDGGYLLGILTQSDFTRLALAVLDQPAQK